MGIAKKGRRKLTVAGRLFIWYVAEDDDSADLVLTVASEDKSFIVKYHLGQAGKGVVGQTPTMPNSSPSNPSAMDGVFFGGFR